MTRTGVVVVSHGESGQAMVQIVEKMAGSLDTRAVTVPFGEPRDVTTARVKQACAELGAEETLFLVDLEGSTPFNVCCGTGGKCVVLSGFNLPMLMKLATVSREQTALELAEELQRTGQKSIHIRAGGSTGDRQA